MLTQEERSELDYVCKCGDSGHDHLSTRTGEAPYRVGNAKTVTDVNSLH